MIRIYNKNEIKILRQSGKILAEIIDKLKNEVKPGIKTEYLNKVAKDLVFSYGAEPSFLGFDGYPAALCTSINEEIVHGVPSNRELKNGDILSLDFGVRYKGYCTDMAVTVPVGKVSKKTQKIIEATEGSLLFGIEQAKAGGYLGDISWAIQNYSEKSGFNIVRQLVGHGVGKSVHEDPQIPNYGKRGTGPKLAKGMVFAIEPMLTVGNWYVEKTADGYGYKTTDNSLSCHFEHTIVIREKGKEPEILTKI